jgi:hypothetical protein
MNSRCRRAAAYVGALGVFVCLGFADTGAQDQRPDFTGVWTTYVDATQGRAGGAGGGRGAQPDLPMTAEAQRKVADYQALIKGTGDTPGGFCLGTGMPGSMLGSGGYPMEIIQRPNQITIIYEAHNEVRRVYLGDRIVPEADRLPGRNGHSTARWEGDTLVVETTNLIEQVDQRYAHSDKARIVERYRMTKGPNGERVLVNEMTMTDPVFYTQPVKAEKKWAEVPNGHLLPYECAEEAWNIHLEQLAEKARTK